MRAKHSFGGANVGQRAGYVPFQLRCCGGSPGSPRRATMAVLRSRELVASHRPLSRGDTLEARCEPMLARLPGRGVRLGHFPCCRPTRYGEATQALAAGQWEVVPRKDMAERTGPAPRIRPGAPVSPTMRNVAAFSPSSWGPNGVSWTRSGPTWAKRGQELAGWPEKKEVDRYAARFSILYC
jgi:hypothetical protein